MAKCRDHRRPRRHAKNPPLKVHFWCFFHHYGQNRTNCSALMAVKRTSFEQLLERAAAQHGFLHSIDADEIAVSRVYLRKVATKGRAEHRA